MGFVERASVDGKSTNESMDDRHHEIIATVVLFFVLSWLAVCLRVYVRGFMMKTWGKDDGFMIATLVVLILRGIIRPAN